MIRNFIPVLKGVMTMCLVMACMSVWGEEVKYAYNNGGIEIDAGTAPEGSSVTLSGTSTASSGQRQMTSGKTTVLTLSGYAGYKITGIKLGVKSNASAGAGSFTAVAGTTTIATIADSKFNTANWNGAWSASTVTKTVDMTNSNYNIAEGENVVLTITASANSLYVCSWTIDYEVASGNTATLESIAINGDLAKTTYTEGDSFDFSGLTVTGTYSDKTTADVTSSVTWTVEPATLTALTTSVTVKASYGGKEATKECAVTVNEKTTTSWNLLTDSYSTKSEAEVVWNSSVATMTLAKGSSSFDANYHLGGTYSNHTAFYQNQILTITPVAGITIKNIVFTCESGYADELTNSTWENASASYGSNIVTVTPTDGSETITCTISYATHVTSVDVTYSYSTETITLGANGYSTYASEYPFVVNTGTAYYATYNENVSTVTLHEITGAVAAGEGVIFKGTEGGEVTIQATSTATAIEGNTLKGVISTTQSFDSGTNYVLSTNSVTKETAFVKMADGKSTTDMLGKAYLNIPSSNAKAVIYFDEATGLSNVVSDIHNADGEIYNITGQRVGANVKGIVIVKGRKYIRR